jgi:hypothetical protein
VFTFADMFDVEDALQMLSTIFVPLMAVVLARVVAPQAHRAFAWIAWAFGLLVFGWINPGFWGPWRDLMHGIFANVLHAPFPLGGEYTSIPGSVCSFAAAAGLYVACAYASSVVRGGRDG